MNISTWFRKYIKPLSPEKRQIIIEEISPLASPGFDFFFLVVLSCSIATLGLITDSPAVIIGAMLVAPLMSPLIGIGLASVTSDTKLLRNALSALFRGALLAIALATVITLINNALPFFNVQELPNEVLSRTRPSPIDLVIALSGGLAAAYAMTQPNLSAALPGVAIATALMPPLCTVGIGIALNRWEVAGGALLLFLTNAITIAFAAVLLFFLRGFSSNLSRTSNHVTKTVTIAAGLTLILLIPLSYFSVRFFTEASENRLINIVVAEEVSKVNGSELVGIDVNRSETSLDMVITIRTGTALRYDQVVALQKAIVEGLHQPVSLKVNQVIAESLDPLIPPTRTSTPTAGPSPTASNSPTPTQTATPQPSATATSTSTPSMGKISRYTYPNQMIYQSPGGPIIGSLNTGQIVTVLYGKTILQNIEWIEIMDSDGRVGWIPGYYLATLTSTPSNTTLPTLQPASVMESTITPAP